MQFINHPTKKLSEAQQPQLQKWTMSLCVRLIIGISLSAILLSCSKSDAPGRKHKDNNQDLPGHISGMGSSNQQLQGTTFNFPATVEISGGIKGVSFGDTPSGYCQLAGSGAFVLMQMEFINHTDKDTLFVLPAGLTFKAENQQDQNGLLIQDLPIPLAKGATCTAMIYVYCINQHRHGSSADSRYSFGPVTNSKPIKALIDLLAHKKVNLSSGETSTLNGPIGDIQIWVWQLTDGEGLTPSDYTAIQALDNI